MSWTFNPFTNKFDMVGSGASSDPFQNVLVTVKNYTIIGDKFISKDIEELLNQDYAVLVKG